MESQPETLINSNIPEVRPIKANYSLKYYCFLKLNSTFANRN